MNSGDTSTLDAAVVLASARASRRVAQAAEARVLADAVAWCRLHEVDRAEDAATWQARGCGDTGIPLGGAGAPLVAEFAVPEFACALGISTDTGRRLLAEALELSVRLPRIWARIQARDLPAWRARRIAAETLCLSEEAADHVDRQLAPFAHRVGAAQQQRLIDETIARFMPDFARERREQAADGRHFDIDHDQISFAGTSLVHGELDLADALDLEVAVSRGAEQLKSLGSVDRLDVRRAKAAGELARKQLALGFAAEAQTSRSDSAGRPRSPSQRDVILYVHLSEAALRGLGDGTARVENHGPHLVTADTVREWLGVPGTRVQARPVLDLAAPRSVTGYAIPNPLREQVILRDSTCVFPWCTRPARRADLDHVVPYEQGGPTSSDNLAPLCRRHHRLKTHGGWCYSMFEPGSYQWMSPLGYRYLREGSGTVDLTPDPIEPVRATVPPDD